MAGNKQYLFSFTCNFFVSFSTILYDFFTYFVLILISPFFWWGVKQESNNIICSCNRLCCILCTTDVITITNFILCDFLYYSFVFYCKITLNHKQLFKLLLSVRPSFFSFFLWFFFIQNFSLKFMDSKEICILHFCVIVRRLYTSFCILFKNK